MSPSLGAQPRPREQQEPFFLPHQDSEKHDDMVATLVVSLPSVHSGGELVVDDGGSERTFRGSRDDLVLVAFYADRRHEVRPVRSGYRVTLTFNLMLTDPTPTSDAGPVEQAARHLTEHFTSRATSRYGGRDLGEPTRLAFLLDHEYTQAGLRSNRFKGADAERVTVLREAAEQAGCETALAVAEIKETWDALPAGESWRYGGYNDECNDPGDDPEDDKCLRPQRADRRRDHARLVDHLPRWLRRGDHHLPWAITRSARSRPRGR